MFFYFIYKHTVFSSFTENFIVLRPNTDLRYDTTRGKYSKNVFTVLTLQGKKTNQRMFLWQSQFTNTWTCIYDTT